MKRAATPDSFGGSAEETKQNSLLNSEFPSSAILENHVSGQDDADLLTGLGSRPIWNARGILHQITN